MSRQLILAGSLVALAGGAAACIQANPDYLGQEGSGGPLSSSGELTQTAASTQTPATSTSGSQSTGTRTSTGLASSGDADTTGAEPTTGDRGIECADGRAGFCYLAPTCVAAQMAASKTAVGDFDGDGDLDVVAVGRMPDSVEGFANDGAGALSTAFFAEVGRRPEEVALLAVGGVPEPLLVIAARDDNVVEFYPLSEGVVGPPTDYDVGNRPAALVVADVAGDPRMDVVAAVRDIDAFVVLEAQPNQTFLVHDPHAVGERPEDIAVGDVNDDGLLDVVTADELGGGVSLAFGVGDGGFLEAAEIPVFAMGRGVALAALDGDPGLDIVSVASSVDGVNLLMTMGPVIEPPVTVPAGQDPREVVARDLNGDGIVDLAVAHAGESALYVFAGQGDGTFGVPLTVGLSAAGYGVSAGDLNGDEIPDLVATAPTAGQICVVLSSLPG